MIDQNAGALGGALRRVDAKETVAAREAALKLAGQRRLCRTAASMAVTMAMEQGGARDRCDGDTLAEEQIEAILDMVRARYPRGTVIMPAGVAPRATPLSSGMEAISAALGISVPTEPAAADTSQ